MDKISETQKSIKKKLSLKDYNSNIGCTPPNKEIIVHTNPNPQNVIDKKQINIRWLGDAVKPKKKMTFYLTNESEVKLNEVFSRRLMNNEKVDKSILINRAVELLWIEEKKYKIQ